MDAASNLDDVELLWRVYCRIISRCTSPDILGLSTVGGYKIDHISSATGIRQDQNDRWKLTAVVYDSDGIEWRSIETVDRLY